MFGVFQALIQLTNFIFEFFFFGASWEVLSKEMRVTFAISTPFVIFSLLMLRYQAELQERLEAVARTDSLTGLPNRGEFFRLAEEFGDFAGAAMLMIDVDHFKQLNDTYGHAYGDQCLRAVASRLRDMTDGKSVIGRLGGEEFAVILPDCPLSEACRIGRAVTQRFSLEGAAAPQVEMTVSAGIAAGQWGMPLADLMRRADEALYAAKSSGRACAVKWTESGKTLSKRPLLAADLPLAQGVAVT